MPNYIPQVLVCFIYYSRGQKYIKRNGNKVEEKKEEE
jgi:hypothetical protein